MRNVRLAMMQIVNIPLDDEVSFTVEDIQRIRVKIEGYEGLRVKLIAKIYGLKVPLSVDFTVGDEIVPSPRNYKYSCQFAEHRDLKILAYSIETVLAEKCEAILQRNVVTTRMRDFYDVYILTKLQRVKRQIFRRALLATCKQRRSIMFLERASEILDMVEQSKVLNDYWRRYQQEFPIAKGVAFGDTIKLIRSLLADVRSA